MDANVRLILSKFIRDPVALNEFTSPVTLSRWKRSLTHESVNYINNYEEYEFLGDAGLSYAFSIYLREDLNITDHGVNNNLLTYYMSKKYQPKIARNIGLDKLIIIAPEVKIIDDFLEDIMESFFGVLEMLCRSKLKFEGRQPASVYIRNFFRWYFSTFEPVDLKKGEEINKSLFNDLYFLLSRDSPQTKYTAYYNPKTKAYSFNPQFITSLSYYNPDIAKEVRKVLTYKGGPDEKYYIDKVIDLLKEVEIDREWFTQEMEKIKFSKEIQGIAKANGLTRFILYPNDRKSYDLYAQKTDPITRKSISDLLHSFDTEDFNELKKESIEIIRKKYSS